MFCNHLIIAMAYTACHICLIVISWCLVIRHDLFWKQNVKWFFTISFLQNFRRQLIVKTDMESKFTLDTSFHSGCEQTCMSIFGLGPFSGCSCCSSIWVHGSISRKSGFSCFFVYPTSVPSHCGQWGETLLWTGFSTQCTCCAFATEYGEETPIGNDSESVGDLREN